MAAVSPEERKKLLAELDAARTKLAELERKACAGQYKAMWWLDKRQSTDEQKKLFPQKHYDDLPGSDLPKGILVEKDLAIEMSDGVKGEGS
jgi:hypothetical protein